MDDLSSLLLGLVPEDGSKIGNQALRERLADVAKRKISEKDYQTARDTLIAQGLLRAGKGRGGSVARVIDTPDELVLAAREATDAPAGRSTGKGRPTARGPRKAADEDAAILSYQHDQRRTNNPEVGMVDPDSDPEAGKTRWAYDPHIDPALQFDIGRAQIEKLIDDALASGDDATMRAALAKLRDLAAPYLNWTGKAERTSFDVDTVSLHVHERIDPATLLAVAKQRMRAGRKAGGSGQVDFLRAWFEDPLPYREAIEFYKHDRGWANRLIAGDSLLVMNSLLQKEGMAGQVQMIYIDPPYGIRYGSNFQPFVNKRDVKDRKDEDLTQEPEMIKAFRDTWELGIHSYLTYLRDRLLLAKELLHESGSVFLQISDENLHRVRGLADEIFGSEQYVGQIAYSATTGQTSAQVAQITDYLIWYSKSKPKLKFNRLYQIAPAIDDPEERYVCVETSNGTIVDLSVRQKLGQEPTPAGRILKLENPTSQSGDDESRRPFDAFGFDFRPSGSRGWSTSVGSGLPRAHRAGRLKNQGKSLWWKSYRDHGRLRPINALWTDARQNAFGDSKIFVVQTSVAAVERCVLMTTDPGDLVLDPTCGSGTTAFVAEKWGRRWITCDTSRVAVTLAKQRLMTASYDYYELKYPHEGLKAGFIYRTVPHVTLKSIANNPEIDEIYTRLHPDIERALADLNAALRSAPPTPFSVTEGGRKGSAIDFKAPANKITKLPSGEDAPAGALLEWEVPFDFPDGWPAASRESFDAFHAARQAMQKRMDASIAAHADQETLYDQPDVSKTKLRITGPFTVEAVPFPSVKSLDDADRIIEPDQSIGRSGESARQHTWRDELLKTGIRGKGGQQLKFAALETLPGTRYLHCSGTLADTGERVVVSFGPEHAALEQRQVEMAIREAGELFPRPKMIVYCAFAFDPEAAKDIDAQKGIVALKVQMNTDLLTEDLKKARASNQSFWLMGQPDIDVRARKDGRYEVEVHGFDYFDTASGELVSGGKGKIAAWSLDTDYDERSLFPRQVFFPMAGAKDGWQKLKRDIKAELDENVLAKLHGTVSLPFEAGKHRKVAVKIVDDRGIESLKVISIE